MEKMGYRVTRTNPGGEPTDVHPSAFTHQPIHEWTQATAVDYAQLGVRGCPPGTIHAVERRRGDEGAWRPYRVYEMGRGGTSRRIDNRGPLRGWSLVLAL